jgi:hypothetical protein
LPDVPPDASAKVVKRFPLLLGGLGFSSARVEAGELRYLAATHGGPTKFARIGVIHEARVISDAELHQLTKQKVRFKNQQISFVAYFGTEAAGANQCG